MKRYAYLLVPLLAAAATPALAALASNYTVDRAESYDTRWSDHTPVVVDYNL